METSSSANLSAPFPFRPFLVRPLAACNPIDNGGSAAQAAAKLIGNSIGERVINSLTLRFRQTDDFEGGGNDQEDSIDGQIETLTPYSEAVSSNTSSSSSSPSGVVETAKQDKEDQERQKDKVTSQTAPSIEPDIWQSPETPLSASSDIPANVSLSAAVRQGLVDTQSGEVLNPLTGERISIEEAVQQGVLDPQLAGDCGVRDPATGENLCLSAAVEKGLFNLASGAFVNPATGEVVAIDEAVRLGIVVDGDKVSSDLVAMASSESLVDAVRSGRVDTRTGRYHPNQEGAEPCSVAEAIGRGHIEEGSTGGQGMSLSDAITQGMVDQTTGKFSDRYSGKSIRIGDAIKRGLLDPDRCEVYDSSERRKVSLQRAIDSGLIQEEGGRYAAADKKTISVIDAAKKNFIYNPLTFKECDDNDLIEKDNLIRDPVTDDVVTILDAVGAGIVDSHLQSIRDVRNAKYVTLCEAIKKDIIDVESGDFKDGDGNRMTLPDAVKKGHLTTVCQKSIFDIDGIKDETTGDYMSFNAALTNGTIDRVSCKLVDKKTRQKLGFTEAADKGLIQPQLLDMLKKPIGIPSNTKVKGELSLLEAVSDGKIDPNSGLLVDSATTNTVPLEKAVQRDMISPMGAAQLRSLLNITVTTATVTQSVKRFVKVSPSSKEGANMSFDEALQRGFVDDTCGTFTDPITGKVMALDKAIDTGILTTSSSSTAHQSSIAFTSSSRKTSSAARAMSTESGSNGSSRTESPDKNYARKDSSSSVRSNPSRKPSTSSSTGSTSSSPRKLSSPLKGSPVRKDSHVESLDTTFEGRDETTSEIYSQSFQSSSATSSRQVHISTHEESGDGGVREPFFSPPSQSFTLKEAMDKNLLDASKGYFEAPEWDKEITFRESINAGFIESRSASVVIDDDQPPMSLQKALENNVLDDLGQYKDGRRTYTLQQAVRTGRVKHVRLGGTRSQSSLFSETEASADVEEQTRVRQESTSGQFVVHPDVTPTELLTALKDGKLRPTDIMVKSTTRGQKSVNILEAIRSGLVDKVTGDYADQGRKINFGEALKLGYVTIFGAQAVCSAIAGAAGNVAAEHTQHIVTRAGGGTIHARIVQSGTTTTQISSFMVEVPGTGEEITLEEAVKRGVVSEETAKMYKEEVTTDSQVTSTVVLITDPETGEEMPSDEAIAKRVVTEEEVAEFLRMKESKNGSSATVIESTSSSEHHSRSPSFGFPQKENGKSQLSPFKLPEHRNGNGRAKSPEACKTPSTLTKSLSYRGLEPETTMFSRPRSSSGSKSPEKAKSPSRSRTPEHREPTKSSTAKVKSPSPTRGKSPVSSKSPSPTKSSPSRTIPIKVEERQEKKEFSRHSTSSTRSSSRSSPVKSSPISSEPGSPTKGPKVPTSAPSSKGSSPSKSSKSSSPIKDRLSASSPSSRNRSPSMKHRSRSRKRASSSSSSSRSSSSGSSANLDHDKSYKSEMSVEIDHSSSTEEVIKTVQHSEKASHTVRTTIVNLKPGYALSSLNDVRNLSTGETMSIYEAKLRGIASDVRDSKSEFVSQQVKVFVNEAVSRNMVNFANGTFTNPTDGKTVSIAEAIKLGLLITEIREQEEVIQFDADASNVSLRDAFQHCFDSKTRKFNRPAGKEPISLQEAVVIEWINGNDIIFDVTSNSQQTLKTAIEKGVLNGKTCEYTVLATNEKHFLLDAAKKGLVAVFPEPVPELELSDVTFTMQEAFENGVYNRTTNMFFEASSQQHITILQALKIGLIDFSSAEVKNTKTEETCNLMEAVDRNLVNKRTGMFRDLKEKKEMTLIEAYETGLIVALERNLSPFECVTLWEAIERKQLDTESGMFYSVHEENKKMTLEEAVYRKYIEKKSAFVRDTWKRKYCSLSEASRKKIMTDGKVMNTTTGKWHTVREAIDMEIIVREIKFISLIEALDYGMYQPYSGKIHMPGFDRDVTLREAIEFKLIDHQKTIVKHRKSGRYVSTLEALRSGDLDGLTGLYNGEMNLLEARSLGFLLSNEAMVRRRQSAQRREKANQKSACRYHNLSTTSASRA